MSARGGGDWKKNSVCTHENTLNFFLDGSLVKCSEVAAKKRHKKTQYFIQGDGSNVGFERRGAGPPVPGAHPPHGARVLPARAVHHALEGRVNFPNIFYRIEIFFFIVTSLYSPYPPISWLKK